MTNLDHDQILSNPDSESDHIEGVLSSKLETPISNWTSDDQVHAHLISKHPNVTTDQLTRLYNHTMDDHQTNMVGQDEGAAYLRPHQSNAITGIFSSPKASPADAEDFIKRSYLNTNSNADDALAAAGRVGGVSQDFLHKITDSALEESASSEQIPNLPISGDYVNNKILDIASAAVNYTHGVRATHGRWYANAVATANHTPESLQSAVDTLSRGFAGLPRGYSKRAAANLLGSNLLDSKQLDSLFESTFSPLEDAGNIDGAANYFKNPKANPDIVAKYALYNGTDLGDFKHAALTYAKLSPEIVNRIVDMSIDGSGGDSFTTMIRNQNLSSDDISMIYKKKPENHASIYHKNAPADIINDSWAKRTQDSKRGNAVAYTTGIKNVTPEILKDIVSDKGMEQSSRVKALNHDNADMSVVNAGLQSDDDYIKAMAMDHPKVAPDRLKQEVLSGIKTLGDIAGDPRQLSLMGKVPIEVMEHADTELNSVDASNFTNSDLHGKFFLATNHTVPSELRGKNKQELVGWFRDGRTDVAGSSSVEQDLHYIVGKLARDGDIDAQMALAAKADPRYLRIGGMDLVGSRSMSPDFLSAVYNNTYKGISDEKAERITKMAALNPNSSEDVFRDYMATAPGDSRYGWYNSSEEESGRPYDTVFDDRYRDMNEEDRTAVFSGILEKNQELQSAIFRSQSLPSEMFSRMAREVEPNTLSAAIARDPKRTKDIPSDHLHDILHNDQSTAKILTAAILTDFDYSDPSKVQTLKDYMTGIYSYDSDPSLSLSDETMSSDQFIRALGTNYQPDGTLVNKKAPPSEYVDVVSHLLTLDPEKSDGMGIELGNDLAKVKYRDIDDLNTRNSAITAEHRQNYETASDGDPSKQLGLWIKHIDMSKPYDSVGENDNLDDLLDLEVPEVVKERFISAGLSDGGVFSSEFSNKIALTDIGFFDDRVKLLSETERPSKTRKFVLNALKDSNLADGMVESVLENFDADHYFHELDGLNTQFDLLYDASRSTGVPLNTVADYIGSAGGMSNATKNELLGKLYQRVAAETNIDPKERFNTLLEAAIQAPALHTSLHSSFDGELSRSGDYKAMLYAKGYLPKGLLTPQTDAVFDSALDNLGHSIDTDSFMAISSYKLGQMTSNSSFSSDIGDVLNSYIARAETDLNSDKLIEEANEQAAGMIKRGNAKSASEFLISQLKSSDERSQLASSRKVPDLIGNNNVPDDIRRDLFIHSRSDAIPDDKMSMFRRKLINHGEDYRFSEDLVNDPEIMLSGVDGWKAHVLITNANNLSDTNLRSLAVRVAGHNSKSMSLVNKLMYSDKPTASEVMADLTSEFDTGTIMELLESSDYSVESRRTLAPIALDRLTSDWQSEVMDPNLNPDFSDKMEGFDYAMNIVNSVSDLFTRNWMSSAGGFKDKPMTDLLISKATSVMDDMIAHTTSSMENGDEQILHHDVNSVAQNTLHHLSMAIDASGALGDKTDRTFDIMKSVRNMTELSNSKNPSSVPIATTSTVCMDQWMANSDIKSGEWGKTFDDMPELVFHLGNRPSVPAEALDTISELEWVTDGKPDNMDGDYKAEDSNNYDSAYKALMVSVTSALPSVELSARSKIMPAINHLIDRNDSQSQTEDNAKLAEAAVVTVGRDMDYDDYDTLKGKVLYDYRASLLHRSLLSGAGGEKLVDENIEAIIVDGTWPLIKNITIGDSSFKRLREEIVAGEGGEYDEYDNASLSARLLYNLSLTEDQFQQIYAHQKGMVDDDGNVDAEIAQNHMDHPSISYDIFNSVYNSTKDDYTDGTTQGDFHPAFKNARYGGQLFREQEVFIPAEFEDEITGGSIGYGGGEIPYTAENSKIKQSLRDALPYIPAEGIDWVTFKSANPKLAQKPAIKKMFMSANKNIAFPENISQAMATTGDDFHLTYTSWNGYTGQMHQKDRNIPNLVMQLNTGESMEKQLSSDPKLWSFFQLVQKSAQGTGGGNVGLHPVTPHSAAWVRMDTSGVNEANGGIIIEELQSDFGSGLRDQIAQIREKNPQGLSDGNVQYHPDEMDEYAKKIEKVIRDWHGAAMNAVIDLAKRQGHTKLYLHGEGVRSAMSFTEGDDSDSRENPVWLQYMYNRWPSKNGFRKIDYTDYPVHNSDMINELERRGKDLQCWVLDLT